MNGQVHTNAGATEKAAARKVGRVVVTLRDRVLAAVVEAGERGLTAVEATEAIGLPPEKLYSCAPRFGELKRAGLVRIGGRRGDRQFYVATEAATEVAA